MIELFFVSISIFTLLAVHKSIPYIMMLVGLIIARIFSKSYRILNFNRYFSYFLSVWYIFLICMQKNDIQPYSIYSKGILQISKLLNNIKKYENFCSKIYWRIKFIVFSRLSAQNIRVSVKDASCCLWRDL